MNVELLINLVQERPVLYDVRSASYKDTRLKDRKWREIASELDSTSKFVPTIFWLYSHNCV